MTRETGDSSRMKESHVNEMIGTELSTVSWLRKRETVETRTLTHLVRLRSCANRWMFLNEENEVRNVVQFQEEDSTF